MFDYIINRFLIIIIIIKNLNGNINIKAMILYYINIIIINILKNLK
jgi:hypothetical protein